MATAHISISIDPDSWNFNQRQKEGFLRGCVETSIVDWICDATEGKDGEALIDFVDIGYDEPV